MTQAIFTHNLGFSRVDADRELSNAKEAYWSRNLSRADLENLGRKIRRTNWQLQADTGLNLVPTGDFAWHDQVLTMSATLGNIPVRHCNKQPIEDVNRAGQDIDLDTLFRAARGHATDGAVSSETAQWFATDHDYLVPEFHAGQEFALSWTQIIDETAEAVALGYKVKPVILGPLSYLWLGKEKNAASDASFDRFDLLDNLLPAYTKLLQALADAGATWVQIDEPILVLDLPTKWQRAFESVYNRLQSKQIQVLLATYFGSLGANLTTVMSLPVAGLHIDAVHAPEQILPIIDRLPAYKILSVGVVDGHDVSRTDLHKSLNLLSSAHERLGDRLWIAPSCSLLHSPKDTCEKLPEDLTDGLTLAKQKMREVVVLKTLLTRPFDVIAQQKLIASNKLHNQVIKSCA